MNSLILIIVYDKLRTEFMQNSGVFEKDKVLIQKEPLVGSVEKGWNRVEELLKKFEDKPFGVVAVMTDELTWINSQIKVVSLGEKWTTLKQWIDRLKKTMVTIHPNK